MNLMVLELAVRMSLKIIKHGIASMMTTCSDKVGVYRVYGFDEQCWNLFHVGLGTAMFVRD
jgi:hypothetical protein